jgi:DNA-binding transcriptional MerR regulator
MTMTVAEMAERAARRGTSKEAFVQRVRHWTRERLLFPLGETNPGVGKHRLYDDAAVQQALILDEMTDTGIPIAKQREIMKVVRMDLEQRMGGLGPRAKKRLDLLLVIERFPEGEKFPEGPVVNFHNGPYRTHPDAVRTITFNLTKLFAVLQNETGGARG